MGRQQIQIWQGQFPPPEAIERYEAVHKGTFDRLVTMAERQQQAQIDLNFEAIRRANGDTQRGQWLGFAMGFAAVIAAAICAWLNQPAIAALLTSVPVLGVSKALVDSARMPKPRVQTPSDTPENPKSGGS